LDRLSIGLNDNRHKDWLIDGSRESDLVIVDTAANDVQGVHDYKTIQRNTEILIKMLSELCVNIMYVGVTTRGSCPEKEEGRRYYAHCSVWKGEWPRMSDAIHIHLPVTRHHGIPYISAVDGLGELNVALHATLHCTHLYSMINYPITVLF
jgi:hypothetical protein